MRDRLKISPELPQGPQQRFLFQPGLFSSPLSLSVLFYSITGTLSRIWCL